jgi:hypothetical protein
LKNFRLTVTIAEHGFSEESADRCFDAFDALYPEAGPVVSQNTKDGTLTVTIAVEATDPWAATNLGSEILAAGFDKAQLALTPVLDVCVTAVEYETSRHVHRGELVSA